MRDHRILSSGVVCWVLLLAGCRGGDEEKGKPQPTAPPRAVAAAKATIAAATLPTATPTEVPTATPVVTPSPLPTAPPENDEGSAEDLKLLGIVRAGAAPSAVIELDGKQEIFRKGDAVFDRGTVKDVKDDTVVIRSGGEDVTLKITKEAPPEPAEPATEPVVESRPPVAQEPPPVSATEPLSRAEVRAALRDLKAILGKAEAKRVNVGGGRGLQLGKVESSSFLAKLGLRTGDVLQKLDGFPVDDAERPPDLSSAAEGKELTVAFTRNEIGLTVTRRVE